jgi:hypothetical protein
LFFDIASVCQSCLQLFWARGSFRARLEADPCSMWLRVGRSCNRLCGAMEVAGLVSRRKFARCGWRHWALQHVMCVEWKVPGFFIMRDLGLGGFCLWRLRASVLRKGKLPGLTRGGILFGAVRAACGVLFEGKLPGSTRGGTSSDVGRASDSCILF